MFVKSLNAVLDATLNKSIVIFGAGVFGRELAGALIDNGRHVLSFFDNNESLDGLQIYGIPVSVPQKCNNSNIIYVISVGDKFVRFNMKNQLIRLGIKEEEIFFYYPYRCSDYHATIPADEYKKTVDEIYKERFGKSMRWDNPKTYNEKINWEKFNINDERRVRLADKVLVRDWVSARIGNEHLTRHYGVWGSVDEISINTLPRSFVLKTNNGSGRNIIVRDKEKADWDDIKNRLNYWMLASHMYECFEMHYDKIKPLILAEEYLEGIAENLYDYNIYCFHGEPKFIWCIRGSHRPNCCASFYDTSWNLQPFSYGYPLDIYPAPRPSSLEKMLDLTRELCKDFEHVRVDWYIMPDNRLLFGEMTFQTWGGFNTFIPSKYDEFFGSLI